MFTKAVKHEAKLRLAIAGPSGGGKTYTALAIGTALGKVAVVDTEHGSASKYADLFDFDVVNFDAPFHPDRFVEAIAAAAGAGYDVVVLDSLSHAWNGSGGLLEIVDEIAKRMRTSNTFAAWKDATPIQNRLVDAIVSAPIHVIATMRSKQEYILEQVERNGRTVTQPKKVGMAPVQRDSFEYEFDVYLDMTIDNDAIVGKTRCPALTGKVFGKPGADIAGILKDWMAGEALPAATQRPAQAERAVCGYQVGTEVMVIGRNDEKLGIVRLLHPNGNILVSVGDRELTLAPDKLRPVPTNAALFEEHIENGAYSN